MPRAGIVELVEQAPEHPQAGLADNPVLLAWLLAPQLALLGTEDDPRLVVAVELGHALGVLAGSRPAPKFAHGTSIPVSLSALDFSGGIGKTRDCQVNEFREAGWV